MKLPLDANFQHSVSMNLSLLTHYLFIYCILLLIMYHDIVDGYAFSQEEHGIMSQVVLVNVHHVKAIFSIVAAVQH